MTSLFARRKVVEPLPPPAPRGSLAQIAQETLAQAGSTRNTEDVPVAAERSVWRPDSWLIQNCWETLSDAAAGPEAISTAKLAAERQPLAIYESLYRLARQSSGKAPLARLVEQTLSPYNQELLGTNPLSAPSHYAQQLLLAAATAAHLGNTGLGLSYLEKLDQSGRGWERIVALPDQRGILAEIFVRVGPTPLVASLLDSALRRFGDAGAELLLRVSEQIDPAVSPESPDLIEAKLLKHCVDAFRYGTLTTLHSHRIAAAVLARSGRFADVINEVTTIANIQEARRLGGSSLRTGDANVLRQVKRPQADADIDFQVYTLREAVRAMPLRYIPREMRVELARNLAQLGMKSDGWTAAGAASTLSELGALKFAADVVQHIAPTDPTRSEGTISLVRGLLAISDVPSADEHAHKALEWARSLSGRNPERALVWGLAEAYLEFGYAEKSLDYLNEWREITSFMGRMRNRFTPSMSDDELRIKRLRLAALLALGGRTPEVEREEASLLAELTEWGARLLEGEALIDFYADGLLRPLLTAGRTREAWALLPRIQAALVTSTGEKHTARVRQVAALLARQVRLAAATDSPLDDSEETQNVIARFVIDLWEADAARGLWQTVHGMNGSLPLVLALEGPGTVAAIAHIAHAQGEGWLQ